MFFRGEIKNFIFLYLVAASGVSTASPSSDVYCKTQSDEARLKSANLELPKLMGEVDRRPDSTYEDVQVTRLRAGVTYELHGLKRSLDIHKLAEVRCDGMQKSLDLKFQLEALINDSEKQGLVAKMSTIDKGMQFAESYLKEARKRLTRNDESTSSVETIAKKYFQLMLLKQEVAAMIQRVPKTETKSDSVELSHFAEKLATVQQINSDAITREAEIVGDPDWKLSVSGGFQRQFFSPPRDRFESVPLFATVSVEIPVGVVNRGSRRSALNESATAWQTLNPESLATHLTENAQLVNDELERLDIRIALQKSRREEIDAHIKKLQQGSNSFRSQIFEAQVDRVILDSELAHDEIKHTLLAKGMGKPTSSPTLDAKKNLTPVQKSLQVTEGEITADNPNAFGTTSTKVRATIKDKKGTNVEILFTPSGQTEQLAKLSSGLDRTQFGIFVAGVNQCNLLYIMWRIQPNEGIVVQKKLNPGMSTHEQCGNNGYKTVKPTKTASPGAPVWGQEVPVNVMIEKDILTVKVRGQIAWQGKVDLDGLDKNGTIGIRTDNVKLKFKVSEKP